MTIFYRQQIGRSSRGDGGEAPYSSNLSLVPPAQHLNLGAHVPGIEVGLHVRGQGVYVNAHGR